MDHNRRSRPIRAQFSQDLTDQTEWQVYPIVIALVALVGTERVNTFAAGAVKT